MLIAIEEFWAITNEEFGGRSEYKVYCQMLVHYTFLSKRRSQLAILLQQRLLLILLVHVTLLLNSY